MARVLITGAAGFIGMHTAIRLLQEGWDVTGLDNMNNYYSVQLKKDRLREIELVSKEVNREFIFFSKDLNSDVWNILSDSIFDAVIHLAAQAGVRYSLENPWAYLESNILGFQKVLDFVELSRIDCFLYASSSSVYGKDSSIPFKETEACNKPESYYAATKKANELMAHSYFKTKGISSIGLRFFTVYGPWGRPDMAPMLFATAAVQKDSIKVFNYGKQSRDFTYVDDIVNGITLLVKSKRDKGAYVYNIGNGSPVNLLDFISLIESEFSVELVKEFMPAQKGDVAETYASTLKLQERVGYNPKVNLPEGIKMFSNWFKEYYK